MNMPGKRPLRSLALVLALAGAGVSAEPPAAPVPGARYLFQVTLHTPEEIEGMLARAEQLAATQRPADGRTGIALVLHGPEVELFARRNYAEYRRLVDRAARLDGNGVVEVKMCRSEMRRRGIRAEDVPAFIELVPYGPDEEQRLLRNGYVYL